MIELLKCEFQKFRRTYINSLSSLGMLFPVILVTVMFIIKKEDFIQAGGYNWERFNTYLSQFFIFLVGPIIKSFIAVFTVYYEYQQRTIKNLLSSPYSRIEVILVKMLYVSVFIVLQYLGVAVLNILCGLLLKLGVTADTSVQYTVQLISAGLSTVMLVPLMMFIAIISRGFIPAMVVTVIGTISNILVLNWEKSYVSPWAVPADIAFIVLKRLDMNVLYPLASACLYFILFVFCSVIYFNQADHAV